MGVFFARATLVNITVKKDPFHVACYSMRGVHMDEDRFTQMTGDLGGLDKGKICKSSGRLYRQASTDRRRLPKMTALFPTTWTVQKRPYRPRIFKLTAGVFFAMRAKEGGASSGFDRPISRRKVASHVRAGSRPPLRHMRRGRQAEP